MAKLARTTTATAGAVAEQKQQTAKKVNQNVIYTNDIFLRFTEMHQTHTVKVIGINEAGQIMVHKDGELRIIKHRKLCYTIGSNINMFLNKEIDIKLIDITERNGYINYEFEITY